MLLRGTQQAEGLGEWVLPALHLLQDISPVPRVQMRPFDKDQIPLLLGNRLTSHSGESNLQEFSVSAGGSAEPNPCSGATMAQIAPLVGRRGRRKSFHLPRLRVRALSSGPVIIFH